MEETAFVTNASLFINEEEYPDLDAQAAAAHLSQAIRFNTTGYVDRSRVNWTEFSRFHDFLKAAYPKIAEIGQWEMVGESILIRIPGSDDSLLPAMFMAHQDVVPVVAGAEEDWIHDPFSGDIADGFIWGRGALDIKNMLIGILEAVEYHLNAHPGSGNPFRRTLYLAFGEDEETMNTGAYRIGQLLKSRGITLEYVLDESGGDVLSAADFGAPGKLICPIGIYEKGYADMRLSVRSKGGHSSNPVHGTSLGALAKAITAIVEHPLPPVLPECGKRTLQKLAPYITQEPMRTWAKDVDSHIPEILSWYLSHENLYYQVQTTIAPTMICGGSAAGNVMPQDMEAVINFRLAPQDTTDRLLAHARSLVDPDVKLDYVQCINASIPSEIDSYGYRKLEETLQHYFRELIFIPALNKASTDAHNYECICRTCLRFGPFLEEEDISVQGIHGTNERISLRAYLQGIRVLIRLMEESCC